MKSAIESDEIESLLSRSPQIANKAFTDRVLARLGQNRSYMPRVLAGMVILCLLLLLISNSAAELWQQLLVVSRLYLDTVAALPALQSSQPLELPLFTIAALLLGMYSLISFSLQR